MTTLSFVCDCGIGVEFLSEARFADERAERAAWWSAADELRERGWQVSRTYRTLCPDCRRAASAGLLDKPLRSIRRG